MKKHTGVWDGLLADCPHGKLATLGGGGAGCVSSQDDTPGIFAEPWDYSESLTLNWEEQMRRLVPTIELSMSKKGDSASVLTQTGRYVCIASLCFMIICHDDPTII